MVATLLSALNTNGSAAELAPLAAVFTEKVAATPPTVTVAEVTVPTNADDSTLTAKD